MSTTGFYDNGKSYTENLKEFLKGSYTEINYFEIEDKPFEFEFLHLKDKDYSLIEHKSPMFLFTREEFEEFHKGKKISEWHPFTSTEEQNLIFF